MFVITLGYTQDIHFSQFYQSPLTLNPALTGDFDGDYRLAGNYRNQWSSVTVPFQTFSISGDAAHAFKQKNIGAGAVFIHDNTGDSKYKTTVLNVSGSYTRKLNQDSTQCITGGIMFGFTSKSLSFAALRFDEQYNGFRYDATLPTNENLSATRQTFLNVHAGALYTYRFSERNQLKAGLALFNLTSPKETYFNNTAIRVDKRLVTHVTLNYQLKPKIDIIPTALYMRQGTYSQLVIGALGKYIVNDYRGLYQAAYAGLLFRTRDAGFLTAGYQFKNWDISMSYDFNLSSLRPASNGFGGVEIAAIYIWKLFKPLKVKHRICPDYI